LRISVEEGRHFLKIVKIVLLDSFAPLDEKGFLRSVFNPVDRQNGGSSILPLAFEEISLNRRSLRRRKGKTVTCCLIQ
jgi:hypothetical protein